MDGIIITRDVVLHFLLVMQRFLVLYFLILGLRGIGSINLVLSVFLADNERTDNFGICDD